MQLMTPIDPRWGIRTRICEGDTRPGSSPFPGILGTLFAKSDPELAGQLMSITISRIHLDKYRKSFEEKETLCRVQGTPGSGFLVVLFPYKRGEEAPVVQPWADESG